MNPTPETSRALTILHEFVLAATLARHGIPNAPDDSLTLAGASRDDLLALAGSTPEELASAAERGIVSFQTASGDFPIY